MNSYVLPLAKTNSYGDWSIGPIDMISSNKLVRDWNDIRLRKGLRPDSSYMENWKPCEAQTCLAIYNNNICYAIAQINEEFSTKGKPTKKYIRGICTSPDESSLGSVLMRQLILNNYTMNTEMKKSQPRWVIAQSFWE